MRTSSLALVVISLLSGCGGNSPNDIYPNRAPVITPVNGPDSFLLFPNPQLQADGTLQTNSVEYARAYYAAIDPLNQRSTLAGFKSVNGFGNGTGTELNATFGDSRDLGYGRRMTARKNADGTVAFLVGNYLVNSAGVYGYSTLNLDAAVVQDPKWHKGTSAIEFSPSSTGGISFAKFYSFDAAGNRVFSLDLDGRGAKAVPTTCLSCHGGRADPLTPAAGSPTGLALFAVQSNSASLARGDAQAHLHALEVDVLDFSTAAGYSRAAQEATLKAINKIILGTYPIPLATTFTEDAGRRIATANEWQGTAANLIKNAYGGDGLPNTSYRDTYLPADWQANGQSTLYQASLVPACRACHILRGTKNQADLDFDTLAKFTSYAARIKQHVVDRGDMPLAKIVADQFYATSMANNMALFLASAPLAFVSQDSAGNALRAGRPIADAGPDRVIATGATQLSAAASLFSTAYQWSFISNPSGATLNNPNSVNPIFTATVNGTYVLQLISSKGAAVSAPKTLTLVVNSALSPMPSAIRFANIKTVLQGTCAGCHVANGAAPISYDNIDRNGDGAINATDDAWLYAEVRGRINFTDIESSQLLRKPSGEHHNGGLQTGFDATTLAGNTLRINYDLFLNWALNGAPQ